MSFDGRTSPARRPTPNVTEVLPTLPELRVEHQLDTALILLCLAAAVTLILVLVATWARRQYWRIPELRVQPDSSIDHCIVIPARDSAAVIGRAVRSFPQSLTVVVDDQSADQTATKAVEAGAVVRPARPLERGWLPKSNACWTGALYTDSAWILFADPETWYDPRFLPSLLTYATHHKLHAATVLPRLDLYTWAERMLVPFARVLPFAVINAGRLANPKHAEAFANGECLLFQRSAYNFIGGHKSVAAREQEDLALARLIKRHRMSMAVLRCPSMARVCRSQTFSEVWLAIEDIFTRGAGHSAAGRVITVLFLLATCLWLPVFAGLLYHHLYLPAVLYVLLPVFTWSTWYGSLFRALWTPFALALCPWITLTTLWKALLGIGHPS